MTNAEEPWRSMKNLDLSMFSQWNMDLGVDIYRQFMAIQKRKMMDLGIPTGSVGYRSKSSPKAKSGWFSTKTRNVRLGLIIDS